MYGHSPTDDEAIDKRKVQTIRHERTAGDLACGATPNCVSSEANELRQSILPFELVSGRDIAWAALRDQVALLPGATVVTYSIEYIHVECRSRFFRFVDDLELSRNSGLNRISVRSASRVGYFDFGANRRRIERLRCQLRKHGLIH